MCGIAGIVGIRKSDIDLDAVIKEMTNSMAHRGPDGMGYDILFFNNDPRGNYVALGHRRLKIIDLSERGRQPMFNSSESIGIVFNGEIYNYVELKKELESSGVSFGSTSDTEVVLKAYESWGTDCFRRFNGMWGLAIFDKAKRRTILARDRFGVKPLYYYRNSTEFVFASEIKALFKHPAVERKPNMERIFRYIALSYR
jgi:asparagine synthase (glutamine-hydrolysing)